MSSSRAAKRAKQAYDDRRRRDRQMRDYNIFGEPAWDLLLLLFITGEEGKTISLNSLLKALVIPETTTMRWLKALESHGLAEQVKTDAGEATIQVTQAGQQSMLGYFSEHVSVDNDVENAGAS